MYELVIIVHFAGKKPHEEVVERNIKSQIRCQMMGLQRIGKRLGATDIAFKCNKQNDK